MSFPLEASYETDFFNRKKYPALCNYLDDVEMQHFTLLIKENHTNICEELSDFLVDVSYNISAVSSKYQSNLLEKAPEILDRLFNVPALRNLLLDKVERPENISCYIARRSPFIFLKFLSYYEEKGEITVKIRDKIIDVLFSHPDATVLKRLIQNDDELWKDAIVRGFQKEYNYQILFYAPDAIESLSNIETIRNYIQENIESIVMRCLHDSYASGKSIKVLLELDLVPIDVLMKIVDFENGREWQKNAKNKYYQDDLHDYLYKKQNAMPFLHGLCLQEQPDLSLISEILKSRVDLNQPCGYGRTPLFLACSQKEPCLDLVALLLKSGAQAQNVLKKNAEKLLRCYLSNAGNFAIDRDHVSSVLEYNARNAMIMDILSQTDDTEMVRKLQKNFNNEVFDCLIKLTDHDVIFEPKDRIPPIKDDVKENEATADEEWNVSFIMDTLISFSQTAEATLILQVLVLLMAVTAIALFASGLAVAGAVSLAVSAGISFFSLSSDEPNRQKESSVNSLSF